MTLQVSPNMTDNSIIGSIDPIEFEQQHVHEVYDQIATHFSNTRYKPWPGVIKFLSQDCHGDHPIIIDIGAGNGKYSLVTSSKGFYIGSDVSRGLLETAKAKHWAIQEDLVCIEKGNPIPKGRQNDISVYKCNRIPNDNFILPPSGSHPQLIQSNALQRCYRNGIADVAICIAVLHHLSTEERRIDLLLAARDALKKGGQLLVTVWAYEQKKGSVGARSFNKHDNLVDWYQCSKGTSEKMKYQRFYHVFTREECDDIASKVPGMELKTCEFEANNWVMVFEKI